jgi:glyoxylase-like metal-dependent hydrolase (beta-lactamase superfamily II)
VNPQRPAARRDALRGLLALGLAGAAGGCATPAGGTALQRVADGVYMARGADGEADPQNLGRLGNAGFIVGDRGVVAVDTGTSHAHGRELLAALRRITPLPVTVALVTHTRPEFLFGGAAYREQGIPIRMQTMCARLMAARCETCLKNLRTQVGEAPMQGTTMYVPDQTFDATHTLDAIGRPVRVLYFGHSSGPGDIAVLDERTGVLFAGGLADHRRIPDIQDSDLPGWHRALAALQALRVNAVVPGHGDVASSLQALGGVERYLDQLERRLRELVASGASLLGVADATDLPEFAAWDQYDTIHRRNTSVGFLRFERELLYR